MKKFRQIIISFIAIVGLFALSTINSYASTTLFQENNTIQTSLSQSDFSTDDDPQITIKAKPQPRTGFLKLIPKFIYTPPSPPLKPQLKVVLKDTDNQTITNVQPTVEEVNGQVIASVDNSQLQPGSYRFEITPPMATLLPKISPGVFSPSTPTKAPTLSATPPSWPWPFSTKKVT